jgi:hypothetical protein
VAVTPDITGSKGLADETAVLCSVVALFAGRRGADHHRLVIRNRSLPYDRRNKADAATPSIGRKKPTSSLEIDAVIKTPVAFAAAVRVLRVLVDPPLLVDQSTRVRGRTWTRLRVTTTSSILRASNHPRFPIILANPAPSCGSSRSDQRAPNA